MSTGVKVPRARLRILQLVCILSTHKHSEGCQVVSHLSHKRSLTHTQNDVYDLELLPRFASAKQLLGKECKTVSVLAGDFVAPSILSCIDSGRAAVDVLGECRLDYCCFGNHENDIPYPELMKRIQESRFTWINTNMTGMPLPSEVTALPWMVDGKMPTHEVLETDCGTRRVALLGLNTPEEGLYPGKCFSNTTIEPIVPCAQKAYDALKDSVDAVVPMTHQTMDEDRAMAQHFAGRLPIIIGGHDHDEFDEVVEGTRITKAGADAVKVCAIDLEWDAAGRLSVSVEMHDTTLFPEDAAVRAKINAYRDVLRELDTAVLCQLPTSLSSARVREAPSTLAEHFLSQLRDYLSADCALVNAGAIRGATAYPAGHHFTFGDLKKELPFNTFLIVVDLLGSVIRDAVEASRSEAVREKKVGGKFLQSCDAVTCCPCDPTKVTHIGRTPLDPNRSYKSIVHYHALMHRMDSITPLYTAGESLVKPPPITVARPVKELLVAHYAPHMQFSLPAVHV